MPKKILVIDDDSEIVDFVTTGLQLAGFEALSAEDGEAGLYVARAAKPDLIVLDLTMPRMHGYAVCQAIRADPEIRNIKIIVTSAKNYPADIKTVMDLGADMYLVKPFAIKDLLGAIQKLLDGR